MRKSKTTSALPPKSPERVSNMRVNGRKPNRDSDIILDVGSLLDELMGGDVESSEEEATNDKKTIKPMSTPKSPRAIKESVSSPVIKPKISDDKVSKNTDDKPASKISDDKPASKNTTTTTAPSPKRSPSHTNFGEELPVYSLRSRRSVNRMEGGIKNDSENSTSPIVASPKSPRKEISPKTTSDVSSKTTTTKTESVVKPPPLRSEYKVSTEEEEQLNMRGQVSRSRRSVLHNGHHADNDEGDKDKVDEIPHRMRARSTVISSSGTKDRLKVRAFQDFTQDMEEQQSTTKPRESRRKARPSSAAVGETSIGRSGSFKRRQQMDGDKALGLFYHSRHSQSQFNDLDTLDESERHLERHSSRGSSIESDPRSPTLRPRDSHSFSPSPLPQSPLISKQQTFDLDQRNILPSPQSPKAAVADEDKESELEVSIVASMVYPGPTLTILNTILPFRLT